MWNWYKHMDNLMMKKINGMCEVFSSAREKHFRIVKVVISVKW